MVRTVTYTGQERRHSNGSIVTELVSGLPVWAKVLLFILTISGPFPVMAGFLVWRGAEEIPAIKAEMIEIKGIDQQLVGNQNTLIKQNEEILAKLAFICAGLAKTDSDRRCCFNAKECLNAMRNGR